MKQLLVLAACTLLFLSCGDQVIDNPPPATYVLNQNYPNPFADSTVVEYGIPFFGTNMNGPYIKIIVYDRFKRKQLTLVDQANHPAGNFKVTWYGNGTNGRSAPTGVYYIELHKNQVFFNDNDPVEVIKTIVAMKK